jgi:serine/threonine-protein kinase RsbW
MDSEFSHTLTGGRADFPALLDALESHLTTAGAPQAALSAVMIATDELVSNVLDHGGAKAVSVTATLAEGLVTVQIEDDGEPFDPLAAPEPDTEAAIDDREIGGLGVHLVRRMMDETAYARVGGRNRFRFSKHFDAASASLPSDDESS